MIQIESIEIQHFRSIYKIKLKNLSDVSVFSGRNDVGKSNILKALNLFFNGSTDWNTPFSFERDFSKEKLAEARKTKVRQFIKISVEFVRGEKYQKSLPTKFTVTKTWYREKSTADMVTDVARQIRAGRVKTTEAHRSEASVQRYINTVRYEYVPAVRDREFYTYMLGRLQDVVLGEGKSNSTLLAAVTQLNNSVKSEVENLKSEFIEVAGVAVDIQLPTRLEQLFRAFGVATKSGDHDLPIEMRGDGIRARFLPSLLSHISKSSKLSFVWGFEEPENNLEYVLASKLANTIHDEYSNSAQIILTSHSPAFFGHDGKNVGTFRVYSDQGRTLVESVKELFKNGKKLKDSEVLYKELGLLEFQNEQRKQFEEKSMALDKEIAAVKKAKEIFTIASGPKVFTEGKWDKAILERAWKMLYGEQDMPFKIETCAIHESDSGGYARLKACVESHSNKFPPLVGIFDNDHGGKVQGFDTLNKDFYSDGDFLKISRGGTSAAIVLPPPNGREMNAEKLNLTLEFYFEDDDFVNSAGGGLRLINQHLITKTQSGVEISKVETTEQYLKQIDDSSKKMFIEQVMPLLPKKSFSHFTKIFDLILLAIKKIEERRIEEE